MMRYEFRTTTGATCCRTNDPKLLCRTCQEGLTVAGTVPSPPDMLGAIRAAAEAKKPAQQVEREATVRAFLAGGAL